MTVTVAVEDRGSVPVTLHRLGVSHVYWFLRILRSMKYAVKARIVIDTETIS